MGREAAAVAEEELAEAAEEEAPPFCPESIRFRTTASSRWIAWD